MWLVCVHLCRMYAHKIEHHTHRLHVSHYECGLFSFKRNSIAFRKWVFAEYSVFFFYYLTFVINWSHCRRQRYSGSSGSIKLWEWNYLAHLPTPTMSKQRTRISVCRRYGNFENKFECTRCRCRIVHAQIFDYTHIVCHSEREKRKRKGKWNCLLVLASFVSSLLLFIARKFHERQLATDATYTNILRVQLHSIMFTYYFYIHYILTVNWQNWVSGL